MKILFLFLSLITITANSQSYKSFIPKNGAKLVYSIYSETLRKLYNDTIKVELESKKISHNNESIETKVYKYNINPGDEGNTEFYQLKDTLFSVYGAIPLNFKEKQLDVKNNRYELHLYNSQILLQNNEEYYETEMQDENITPQKERAIRVEIYTKSRDNKLILQNVIYLRENIGVVFCQGSTDATTIEKKIIAKYLKKIN